MTAGGYNRFTQIDVNGRQYTNAIINFNNTDALTIHNNTFDNFQVIDTNTIPTPDNRKATLYLAGTAVNDNIFKNMRLVNYPIAIVMEGSGVRHNLIEAAGFFGQVLHVSDTTAPARLNTVRVQGGGTTGAASKITHTGGMSRIIDTRGGAENGGTATTRTDGSTIAHGLFATPTWYHVTGTVAGEIVTAMADATNLTLAIKTGAGAAGTSQSVAWRAGVYP